MRCHFAFPALLVMSSLLACTPVAPPPIGAKPVELADGQTVEPDSQSGLNARSIELARVQIDIPRGTEIGRLAGLFGNKCRGAPIGPIYQDRPRTEQGGNEWSDAFYRVMNGHGFRVAGDPGQLFQTKQADSGDLQFGVIITEMRIDAQAVCDFFSERAVGMRVTSRVVTEWQVFDAAERRVVLRQRSTGNFDPGQIVVLDGHLALQHAFADAVNQLAASPGLRQLMQQQPVAKVPPAAVEAGARLPLRRMPNSKDTIDSQIDHLRSATVLIEAGAGSHGSGFIISEGGLMVTNQHVVGGQRFVRVRLISGREVIGEVLRQHDRRDVALVKLEGTGYPAMAVRETPVRVAEEVYAIGAPQRKSLAWTVTRGVVSAYRQAITSERVDMIQSDVPIHGGNSGGPMLDRNGNVIGIAVAGYSAGPDSSANASLNLFIPILDGLDKLGLDLVDAAEFERRRVAVQQ